MPQDKPNILVIWGDDIGTWNISHTNRGMMGYETPNIDRIAAEGPVPAVHVAGGRQQAAVAAQVPVRPVAGPRVFVRPALRRPGRVVLDGDAPLIPLRQHVSGVRHPGRAEQLPRQILLVADAGGGLDDGGEQAVADV